MNRRAFLGLIGSAVAWLPVAMAKQAPPVVASVS